MQRISLLAASFAILLLASGPAFGRTVGISPGDSATYSYVIVTTQASPNGNVSTSIVNQESVTVNSVNLTGRAAVVGYTLTITEANGTVVSPPLVATNYTSVFDPYYNLTYFSQPWIGWYPFTFTDLTTGKANLGVNVTETGVPVSGGNITLSVIAPINATISRSPGLIDVDFTSVVANVTNDLFVMRFNSTTGWLERGVIYANAFDVEKIFTYQLLSYTHHKPAPDYSLYAIDVALFAVAAIVVYEVVARKSRSEKRESRIREKYGGR